MERNIILGIGVVLSVLGVLLLGVANYDVQLSNSNYQACLKDFEPAFCNSVSITWGVPLEIWGAVQAVGGAGLIILTRLRQFGSKKPTSSS